MQEFLWGALAMSAWIGGLFFFRFWWLARDRLFLYFSFAFWILAANWLCLVLSPRADEATHWVYLLRVVAFALIIAGILDKNRRVRAGDANRSDLAESTSEKP